ERLTELELLVQRRDAPGRLGAGESVQRGEELQVVTPGESREQPLPVSADPTHPRSRRAVAVGGPPEHLHAPGVRDDQTSDQAQDRRLARAVVPPQDECLTWVEGEIDPPEHRATLAPPEGPLGVGAMHGVQGHLWLHHRGGISTAPLPDEPYPTSEALLG